MRVCKISLKLLLTLGMSRGPVIITITTSDEARIPLQCSSAALQNTAAKYRLVKGPNEHLRVCANILDLTASGKYCIPHRRSLQS